MENVENKKKKVDFNNLSDSKRFESNFDKEAVNEVASSVANFTSKVNLKIVGVAIIYLVICGVISNVYVVINFISKFF